MDWIPVFSIVGGAAGFATALKLVAEKLVEQVISTRGAVKVELAKISHSHIAEHNALVARTRLDVLGALLDAIYSLKNSLRQIDVNSPRLDWSGLHAVARCLDDTISGLEANLGGKRAYIPAPFDVSVHSLKNELYDIRVDVVGALESTRGRKHLSKEQSDVVRRRLMKLNGDVAQLFSGMVAEAQRRISEDLQS